MFRATLPSVSPQGLGCFKLIDLELPGLEIVDA